MIEKIEEIQNEITPRMSNCQKRAIEFVNSLVTKDGHKIITNPYTVARLAYEFHCKELSIVPDDIKHIKD